uniref:Serine/threonine-protein phosphatase 4 regulatory subunit 2-like n=1 Tax=Hippocampus comes TaxID=109280 RepID=A0A3Q2Y8R6_HIPCM
MDTEALLEAFQDFEKKTKRDTSPVLEQYLCHVAKTGEAIIPFTIQRLCELLTDPKRNYTGTDKFLRGIEKNVMVVSCVYPMSEKNGSSNSNRMNGVMFPGNSVHSDGWELLLKKFYNLKMSSSGTLSYF